jgi:hypothetical protein
MGRRDSNTVDLFDVGNYHKNLYQTKYSDRHFGGAVLVETIPATLIPHPANELQLNQYQQTVANGDHL